MYSKCILKDVKHMCENTQDSEYYIVYILCNTCSKSTFFSYDGSVRNRIMLYIMLICKHM